MIQKSIKLLLVLGTMTLLLSGCTPQSQRVFTKTSLASFPSQHPVQVLMAKLSNVPTAEDRNPIRAAEASMSWELSNGKTVQVSSISDVVAANLWGNISVVALKVPDVTPIPIDYFLYMEKQKNLWTVKAVLAGNIEKALEKTELQPYSNLIDTEMTVKDLGRFEEFYSDKTVITLANLPATDTDLPSGKKLELHDSELPTYDVHRVQSQKSKKSMVILPSTSNENPVLPVTLFSQGNEQGLYYRLGSRWICVEGNVSKLNLIRISKDLQSHVFNVLGSGYYIAK
ncbi:MAG: hypothetical protein OWS03_09090 [Alicyclobacillaceae bacterium]|nr:hypothetical protein [Alicyclobacillaceae bacterium]